MANNFLYSLALATALVGCATTGAREVSPRYESSNTRSATPHHVGRPSGPTETRRAQNILEIETNGYDVSLEHYLRSGRNTIVNLGASWCSPCQFLKYDIAHRGQNFPDLDFLTVDLDYTDENGQRIVSPAERYLNGTNGIPYFLFYRDSGLVGTYTFDPYENGRPLDIAIRHFRSSR